MDSRLHPATPGRRPASSTPRRFDSPAFVVEDAIRGLLRQRSWLTSCLVLSLLGALAAAYFLRSSRHTYEGALLYTPNDVTAPYYSPPELSNLVHIVHSPTLLTQLRDQFQLSDALSTLKRDLQFELVPGGDTVVTRVIRKDPVEAMNMLNAAMSLFVNDTRRLRKQTLERFVNEFQSDLLAGNQALEQAIAQVQGFLDKHDVQSSDALNDSVAALQHSATELDMELQMARVDLTSAEAKRERLTAIKAEKTGQGGDAPGDPSLVANVPLTRVAERRHFMRDQVLQEQQASSYNARLQVKQKEHERAKELHAKGLISDAELEQVEGELAILRAEQNSRVVVLQQQLSDVEQKLAKGFADPAQLLLSGQGALAGLIGEPEMLEQSLAVLELDILGAKNKVDLLTEAVNVKQGDLTQVSQRQKEVVPLLEAVRIAAAERDRLQNLVKEFDQARRSEVDDLKVSQSATQAIDGVRSSAAQIFAGTFVGIFGLLLSPALYREWQKQTDHSAANIARNLGVPVLADFNRASDTDDLAATLAVRVRRKLPDDGSVLLFTGTKSSAFSTCVPKVVAQAAAQSGESVVLVDLVASQVPRAPSQEASLVSVSTPSDRGHTAGVRLTAHESQPGPGLAVSARGGDSSSAEASVDWSDRSTLGVTDFLLGAAFDVDQLTRSSEYPNLCFINSGTTTLTSELIASSRLGDFFKQLKSGHALVVIAGPHLDQRLQVECLSDAVDGIVVVCPPKPFDKSSAETVQALVDANAPIIGLVA